MSACSRRADSITDLDEGAAPQDPLEGPAAASSDPSTADAQKAEAEDPSVFLRQEGEEPETYARRIFRRVYHDDIQRVLSMEVRSWNGDGMLQDVLFRRGGLLERVAVPSGGLMLV